MTAIVPAMQDSYAVSSDYYTRKKAPETVAVSADKTSAVQSGSDTPVNVGQSKEEREKNESRDPTPVKQLEKAHVDALKAQWDTFLARVSKH
ncbi:hypothetical protein [Cronobacter sakazakii]|uniref:hypothetical protein n=1 Tax=Cronobacter sakazakii TaxID=28141 RepID=UPI001EFCBA7E|nr:hypothetical protein [Cronobacter sakazakii]